MLAVITKKYGKNTVKLAITYLAIIMAMSLSFSFVLYNTSVSQLRKPIPGSRAGERGKSIKERVLYDSAFSDEAREILNDRFNEAKEELLTRLLLLNILILAGGTLFSFYLARRTLEPIEKAMESQTRFVSDASHELRTPLAVLQTTNEVALRKKNISDKEARILLKQNIFEVERLTNLSNSLLDLLKKSGDAVELVDNDLKIVVSESLGLVQQRADKKHIKIINKVNNQIIKTDFNSAVRIVTILLDNAVKYSPEKSTISLSVFLKDKYHYLEVADEGFGIKDSDLPFLFDRFYRADSSRTKNETIDGYGLGLSIAKQTAEQINADISVKSTPGKGTSFYIRFPN